MCRSLNSSICKHILQFSYHTNPISHCPCLSKSQSPQPQEIKSDPKRQPPKMPSMRNLRILTIHIIPIIKRITPHKRPQWQRHKAIQVHLRTRRQTSSHTRDSHQSSRESHSARPINPSTANDLLPIDQIAQTPRYSRSKCNG